MSDKTTDKHIFLVFFDRKQITPQLGSVIILGDLTICHKNVSLRYAT